MKDNAMTPEHETHYALLATLVAQAKPHSPSHGRIKELVL
jgi:hypothetical protein